MTHDMPDPDSGPSDTLLALHRAHQLWPNPADLRSLAEQDGLGIFPYETLDQALKEVTEFHHADQVRTRLSLLSDRVRIQALNDFCSHHMGESTASERKSVTHEASVLFREENLQRLEEFLQDVITVGHVKALENLRKRDSGSKAGHILSVFWASLEVVFLLLILRACAHGFQAIVVAAIGFSYCSLMLAVDSVRLFQFELLFISVLDTKIIRRLLNDSVITTANLEADRYRHGKQAAVGNIRFYILAIKLGAISLICSLALIWNALF